MVSHVEILMILLVSVGHPHLDEAAEPFLPGGQSPMVFPSQLPQASAAISGFISDALGLSDHEAFMSDLYWPVPLNNSSIFNLTA